MKKSFSKILSAVVTGAVLAASAIFSFSCTGFNDGDTCISISIDGQKLIGAKNVAVPAGENQLYLVATVTGDYNDYKLVKVDSISRTYNIDLVGIPVGAKVTVGLDVYDPKGDEPDPTDPTGGQDFESNIHTMHGVSQEFVVKPGRNDVPVKIKSLTTGNTALMENSIRSIYRDLQNSSFDVYLYYSGKYQIRVAYGAEVWSEGLWSLEGEDFTEGVRVTFTEYYHKSIVPSGPQEDFPWVVTGDEIVTNPVPQISDIAFDGESFAFYLTSGNGIKYRVPKGI